VTSGLKHVDKSQMTHKNPELRASSVCVSRLSIVFLTCTGCVGLCALRPCRLQGRGLRCCCCQAAEDRAPGQ
jgi:hypothetical protein